MTHVRRTADRSVTRWLQLGPGYRNGDVMDRMTLLAFWNALPSDIELDVDVSERFAPEASFLPDPHHYVTEAISPVQGQSAVLAGTPSTVDAFGSDAMLREIGPHLEACHRAGIAVDAVGVAVDRPQSGASRDRLARLLAPIRSWSVRSSQCRDVLLELGVDRDRIVVGADWLWLYAPRERDVQWAEEEWRRLGVDSECAVRCRR
jgi:hypothetical protein